MSAPAVVDPAGTTAARPVLDALARGVRGRFVHGHVRVVREAGPRRVRVHRAGPRLLVRHGLLPADLDERLVPLLAAQLDDVDELAVVLTGVVLSTVDDPLRAWTRYYRQSLAQLERGATGLGPVHAHAVGLLRGRDVLELGSCFGFLALAAAARGHRVTATDVSPGTVALLEAVAPRLGHALGTAVCDAAAVPRPDGCADTVLAVHLLEHVDAAHGAAVVAEALRLARRRVVLAVPFEDVPDAAYGHVRTFTAAQLRATCVDARPGDDWSIDVHSHHGGWVVLDRVTRSRTGTP
ncbi:mycofactocin oligosaccharide methyltransferase MftM [Rhodococcus aerolatus]